MTEEIRHLIGWILFIAFCIFLIIQIRKFRKIENKIYLDELNQKKYCVDCVSCKSYLCRNIRSIYHKDNVKDLFACRLYNERRV